MTEAGIPTNAEQQAPSFDEAAAQMALFLADPAAVQEPYAMFRAIRAVEPVHWSSVGTWIVTGHPEGRTILSDARFSRARAAAREMDQVKLSDAADVDAMEIYKSQLAGLDDPDHARIRALMTSAFMPRAVRMWEAAINRAVDELVEQFRDRETFDLLHDFAFQLPSRIICAMVGVPVADQPLFERWTNAFFEANRTDPNYDMTRFVANIREFANYLRELVLERQRRPEGFDDLATLLIAATHEGGRLSERELIASLMLVILGGHDTTANLIANGTLALIQNPDQYDLLRSDPGLVNGAIEEFLRYTSPARSGARMAIEDVRIGDALVRAGDRLQVHIGAANRDPRVFADPDRLDLGRKANNHLGFGFGGHFCLGVHIARLEAQRAMAAIATRFARFELMETPVWRGTHTRGLRSLKVAQLR